MSRSRTPRRLGRSVALALGLLLVAVPAAWAVTTDDFTDPLVIPPAGATTAIIDTTAFTVQGGEPTAADGLCPARLRTAWFSIVGNGRQVTAAIDAASVNYAVVVFPVSGAPATPMFGTPVGCNDGPANTGQVTFASTRGQRYLVQVGSTAAAGGSVRMTFTTTRPAADDRAAPAVVGLGSPTTVDQSGATSEAGEVLTCGSAALAGTVWFRYTATTSATVRFASTANLAGAAKPADTVLSVYPGNAPAPSACNDDVAPDGSSAVQLSVAPGDYLVQVGAKRLTG